MSEPYDARSVVELTCRHLALVASYWTSNGKTVGDTTPCEACDAFRTIVRAVGE